jgi:hypothetical protein
MNTKEPLTREEMYRALKRPFPERKISWRVGATNKEKTKGIALAYIDARDVMNRFDDVCGTDWQCKYSHAGSKTICDIGIRVCDEWIWRSGGAGDTDIEAEKGAISDAFKRAAVLFGVGRYLYELPNVWVEIDDYKKLKSYPQIPEWATPKGFDCGLTPDGPIFGESRKRLFDGMFEEIVTAFGKGKTEAQQQEAYELWTSYIPQFQLIEEQNYTWFLLPSDLRSAIKRLQLINQPMKEAA